MTAALAFARVDGHRLSAHGTAVAERGAALLLLGPSGAGKSTVAAGMIALGARLLADDLVLLRRRGAAIEASAPPAARGGIELRGLGLVAVDRAPAAPVAALVLLGPPGARLPEPEAHDVLDVSVPLLRHPAEPAAAAKLLLWLRAAAADHGAARGPSGADAPRLSSLRCGMDERR